ncbi:MAG: chromosome segregation protein SMC [Candidatus Coatesbacteria bacterium]|nr:MAG: chromosome segregation protein SMC [Candidatus Coatesbacteria bacterium]
MRLARVEMFGFKSFPKRTVFEFPEGITAIVGPNGCGKSNVVDAVRWALGEQSTKSLRGRTTGDMIFTGASDMPPMSMAEVSLYFDNVRDVLPVDDAELLVTRRAFRSGENQYLINGRPVRLKDLLDLFSDTGLGKASYTLVEQGLVDRLVNAKPEERRAVFEEAAGVRRYRTKREEAMRKLDDVRSNMERLEDLLDEYRRQARSLKRQANAARRYAGYRDRVKKLDIGLAKLRWDELDRDRKSLLNTLEETKAAAKEADHRYKEAAAALSAARADLETAEISRQEIDESKLAAFKELSEAENELGLLREKAGTASEEVARLERAAEETGRRIELNGVELVVARKRAETAGEESGKIESEIESVKDRVNALIKELASAETGLAAAREEATDKLESLTALRNRLAVAGGRRDSLERELKRLEHERGKTAELFDEIEKGRGALAEETERLRHRRAEVSAELKSIDEAIIGLTDGVEKAEKERREKYKELESTRSRLASLEELIRSFESYDAGAAALMKGDTPASVSGVLADIIEVETGYEKAVESALGAAAGALLADGFAGAGECARRLAENDLGRAAFLVPVVEGGRRRELPDDGIFIGRVGDFAKASGRHGLVVTGLLNDVGIVKDLRDLVVAAEKYTGLPVVTISGDYWDGRALLTAGSVKEVASSILGRKAECSRLAELTRKAESELKESEERIAGLRKELDAARARRTKLERAGGEIEASLAAAAENAVKDAERAERARAETEVANSEYRRTSAEAEAEKKTVSEIEEQVAAAQARLDAAREMLAAAETVAEKTRAAVDEAKEQTAAMRERSAEITAELKAAREEEKRLKGQIASDAEEFKKLTDELEAKKQSRVEIEARVKDAAEETRARRERHEGIEGRARDRKLIVDEAKAKVRDAEAVEKEATSASAAVRERTSELEIELTKLAGEMSTVNQSVSAQYELSLENISPEEYELDVDPETAVTERDELERKLARMGEVNFRAAREYETTTARVELLEEQMEDLTEAEKNLLESIDEIDAKSRKRFVEVFGRVQDSFREIFADVFEGGQADLRLEGDKDPLEAGVLIYAEPPGKRMRLLSLLSGGEKAMTGIALLFALLEARPAPFVILDEADAPLDDANIERYLKLIDRNLERCQFVLMTHVKRTMTAADTIYGVTMERKGVSKVVSLKLDEVTEEYVGEPV